MKGIFTHLSFPLLWCLLPPFCLHVGRQKGKKGSVCLCVRTGFLTFLYEICRKCLKASLKYPSEILGIFTLKVPVLIFTYNPVLITSHVMSYYFWGQNTGYPLFSRVSDTEPPCHSETCSDPGFISMCRCILTGVL